MHNENDKEHAEGSIKVVKLSYQKLGRNFLCMLFSYLGWNTVCSMDLEHYHFLSQIVRHPAPNRQVWTAPTPLA